LNCYEIKYFVDDEFSNTIFVTLIRYFVKCRCK